MQGLPFIRRTFGRIALGATLIFGALISLPATSATIQYSFEGVVDSDPDGSGLQTFAGLLRFETVATDLIPNDDSAGVYAMPSLNGLGFVISFDAQSAQFFDVNPTVTVLNDYAGLDWFLPIAQSSTDSASSLSLEWLDFEASAFADDGLPLAALNLNDFESALLRLNSPDFGLIGRITGWVCDIGCVDGETPPGTPVPLPASWMLVMAAAPAAVLLGGRRRRRAAA